MCTSKPHLYVHVLTLETVLVDVPKAEHAHSKPCSSHTTSLPGSGAQRRDLPAQGRGREGGTYTVLYMWSQREGRVGRGGGGGGGGRGREGGEGREGSIHSLLCL